MRRPIDPAVIVAGLRAFADELEAGYRPAPQAGQGVRRVGRATVVPLVLHDAICGWRVATLQDESDTPRVLGCAGCGLAYLEEETRRPRLHLLREPQS